MANKIFHLAKELQQTNKYLFTVEAETEEEAKEKLEEFLRKDPHPSHIQWKEVDGVLCYDRETDV